MTAAERGAAWCALVNELASIHQDDRPQDIPPIQTADVAAHVRDVGDLDELPALYLLDEIDRLTAPATQALALRPQVDSLRAVNEGLVAHIAELPPRSKASIKEVQLAGVRAGARGALKRDCPFMDGVFRAAWLGGWVDGQPMPDDVGAIDVAAVHPLHGEAAAAADAEIERLRADRDRIASDLRAAKLFIQRALADRTDNVIGGLASIKAAAGRIYARSADGDENEDDSIHITGVVGRWINWCRARVPAPHDSDRCWEAPSPFGEPVDEAATIDAPPPDDLLDASRGKR